MGIKTVGNGLLNLAIRRYAGPFWYRRRWLEKTQWLSKKQLESLQLELLQKLIRHCHRTVPYYQNLMDDRGIKVDDIKRLADMQQFPILTRSDILNAGSTLISEKYPRFLQRTAYTGGTTGTPMRIRRDLFSIGNEHAFVRRQWDWAGIDMKDKCAFLTGRLIADTNRIDSRLYSYDPIMKELILSTYHLSESTAIDYAKIMKQYKVKAIAGYPSAVYLLAKICIDHGISIDLKAALTSSETLTSSMRIVIEEAFGCQVFDYYGSAERVCYIFTCEKGSYHIQPEYGYTELIPVSKDEPDKCKVVSTGFWNLTMPLIRYDLGDVVVKSGVKCSCGRMFPVVKAVDGRKADAIKTLSGREFGAAILTHLLYGTDHIVESQIIQNELETIIIQYVPDAKFSVNDLCDFRKLINQHLPGELKVQFEQVRRIERTNSGKLKPLVSNIS